jgi:diguanylate cyclase (GGDEF)-like protein
MVRKRITTTSSGRTILLVDDNVEYLTASRRLIERDGHEVLIAESGLDGLAILRARRVDVVLVDYHMPHMNGEAFVTELRAFDPLAQVILQTGYANEHPPREMLRRLDIQGYHDKSDGPERLCLWVDVALKAAYATQLLHRSREGLRYIVGITPELHKLQPLEDLLQGILLQTAGVLGASDSFLAVVRDASAPDGSDGFVAMVQDGGEIAIRAATGRYASCSRLEQCFGVERRDEVLLALGRGTVSPLHGAVVTPLRVGNATLGFVYLDRPLSMTHAAELLEIFANQAAVAIHNAALYELAALDPLTGVYARRFLDHAVSRELRSARRMAAPLALLLVDLDRMKQINDGGGHLTGDRALKATGALLKSATRASDVVGRYGGDEFALLLPGADLEGARVVAARIAEGFESLTVAGPDGPIPVRGSVGGAVLLPDGVAALAAERLPHSYFAMVVEELFVAADAGLYAMKRGAPRAAGPVTLAWPAPGDEPSVRSLPRQAQWLTPSRLLGSASSVPPGPTAR